MILSVHILLAIFLFFFINLIGKYAPTELKYYQISNFLDTDEAPAFNFTFKVLTPVVLIIIFSAILYYFNLDMFVKNIYQISIFYILFRAIFNLLIGRFFLVNWKKQFVYAVFTIGITYLVYDNFLITKKNILPDFSTISNELWVIILIFVYTLINKIPSSDFKAKERKFIYIKDIYFRLQNDFSDIVNDIAKDNIRLRHIVYSIMIHENFNRPKFFRILEYTSGYFSQVEKTYGVMQVKSSKLISDSESVVLGSNIILKKFNDLIPEFNIELEKELQTSNSYNPQESVELDFQIKLIKSYNNDNQYAFEIIEIANYLNDKFHQNILKNKFLFS